MGGYSRQGHSMVRKWCTATKSKMRKNKDGSEVAGMYGVPAFKYYTDGTCTDTYDYCENKKVSYDPATENCYVSTAERIFYMIFGRVITDNVIGGFEYAANLSAYGVGWLNKHGQLPVKGPVWTNIEDRVGGKNNIFNRIDKLFAHPSFKNIFELGETALILGALGTPPALEFLLMYEGGRIAWHDRKEIMKATTIAVKAVKNTVEDAGDCMTGAVGNEAAMKKCKGLIDSIEHDGKVVGKFVKKMGLVLSHTEAGKQMDHLAKKGIKDLKKTYKSLKHLTEDQIKAAHHDILKFGHDVKNDADDIANGVKNIGKHIGHDAHHVWHDISSWF